MRKRKIKKFTYNNVKKYKEDILENPIILKMLGIELKRRRISTSKTLAEYSCGCSLSYLSKIENAKIIPNFMVLCDYCAQNGINEDELLSMLEIDALIDKLIYAYTFHNNDEVSQLVYQVNKFHNYKTDLVRLFHYAMLHDMEGLDDALVRLNCIYDDLEEQDRYILIYFNELNANYNHLYFDALMWHFKFRDSKNSALNALVSREYLIACLESSICNPTEVNSKLQGYFMNYNSLLDSEVTDAFRTCLIKSGLRFDTNSVRFFNRRQLILYHALSKDYASLVSMDLEKEKYDIFERLLVALFLNKISESKKIFKELKKDEISYSTLVKLEFFMDYISLHNIDLIEKIHEYHVNNIPYIHDMYYLNEFLMITLEVSLKTNHPEVFQEAYSAIAKLMATKFDTTQFVPKI